MAVLTLPVVTNPQGAHLVDVNSNPISSLDGGLPTTDRIRSLIMNGQGFIYSAANGLVTATNPNLTVIGLSIFNPASPKNILIYSVLEYGSAGGTPLQATTTNPAGTTGFTGTGMVASNVKPGGPGSVASLSTSPTAITASVALPGTFLSIIGASAIGVECLPNGAILFLPAGVNSGYVFSQFVATSGSGFGVVAKGIEF